MKNSEKKVIIYEVLRIINKKALFLKEHLERMENSFKLINMKMPLTLEEVETKINETINSKKDSIGNIKVTYEIDSKELKAFYIPHSYPTEQMYKEGVKTIFFCAERENPNAKIINDELRTRINEEIKAKNAYEAILVDHNGNITEGSKSNIFMVKDGILMTSPGKAVLPGVTRMKVIEVAKKLNIPFKEVEYNHSDINKLDAMFISGTSPKILPIKYADDISLDINNNILRKIMKGYDEIMNQNIYG